MGCLSRIREFYPGFTSSEQKIADFILGNADHALECTAAELSVASGVSPATVIRFTKTIGFSGFSEMKLNLARDMEASIPDEMDALIRSEDSITETAKKMIAATIRTLHGTLGLVHPKELDEAVSILKEAKTIYLFAVGASALVAEDFQKKMVRINKPCIHYDDSHLALSCAVHITAQDAVLAISHSGQTREVNLAVERARKNGAKCIAVTRCEKSRLFNLADICLFVPNMEREVRIGAIQSRYAQVFLIDLLYMGIIKDHFDEIERYLECSREVVRPLKEP